MVELEFYWDGFSYFEDEKENCEMELSERYKCETWQECCDNCANNSLDWDDSDLPSGEDCTETSREFTRIKMWDEEKGEYKDAPQEVEEYYLNAVNKLEEEEYREQEERIAKRKEE